MSFIFSLLLRLSQPCRVLVSLPRHPLSLCKMYYQNTSGASNHFLPRAPRPARLPDCPPALPCSISVKISGENYSPTLSSFHSTLSLSPFLSNPIQIDLQAFSSSSPALRTTLKSTCELRSLISLRKRLARSSPQAEPRRQLFRAFDPRSTFPVAVLTFNREH